MSVRNPWKRILFAVLFAMAFATAAVVGNISTAEAKRGEQSCPDLERGQCNWYWGEGTTSGSASNQWYVKMQGAVRLRDNDLVGDPQLDYTCKVKLRFLPDLKFCDLVYHGYDRRYGQIATFKMNNSVFQVRVLEALAKVARKSRLWSMIKASCATISKCDAVVKSLQSARISYRTYAIPPKFVGRKGRVICEKTDSFTWIDGRKIVKREYYDCGDSSNRVKGSFFGRT